MRHYPLREIRQIEITSECNLACKYCPHPKMKRTKAHMDLEVFTRSLEWVDYFVKQGTQHELALTGIGEPLMHPEFLAMVKLSREVIPDGKLLFSTNGILLCNDEGRYLAQALKKYDIEVYVSTHRPEKAGPAAMNAARAGLKVFTHTNFIASSFDWAGQVDWEVSAPRTPCGYLGNQMGAIMQDGSITACCMDAEGVGIIGHINDEIGSVNTKPYSLCKTCNYTIPDKYT